MRAAGARRRRLPARPESDLGQGEAHDEVRLRRDPIADEGEASGSTPTATSSTGPTTRSSPATASTGSFDSGISIFDLPRHCSEDTSVSCTNLGGACAGRPGHLRAGLRHAEVAVHGSTTTPTTRPTTPARPWTYPVVFEVIDGTPDATLDDTEIAAFAQDSWQATPGLLFDFGLRYDLDTFTLPSSAKVVLDDSQRRRRPRLQQPRAALRLHLHRGEEPGVGRFAAAPGSSTTRRSSRSPRSRRSLRARNIGFMFPSGILLEMTEDYDRAVRHRRRARQRLLVFPTTSRCDSRPGRVSTRRRPTSSTSASTAAVRTHGVVLGQRHALSAPTTSR